MPEFTNKDRAAAALVVIEAFMKETGTDREDAISDLISDLCHLSDQDGVGATADVARGLEHYYAETHDEKLADAEINFYPRHT